jgi:hypothetical protein
LDALIEAFKETDSSKTYKKWQKVDEIWMKLQDDIQICHPLEFYEDKYAKAVAPEWDLRVKLDLFDSQVKSNILNLLNHYKFKYPSSIFTQIQENLDKTYLYISEPVLYFGSELEGLFSAQVVPNDEEVSQKYGKKIFAFPRKVLEDKKRQPLTKLSKLVFSDKILKAYKEILEDEITFYRIYDVETIGHEF